MGTARDQATMAVSRKTMQVAAISVASLLVCGIVAMAMVDTTVTQALASKSAKGSKALVYGATVTLMNPYNEYVLVERDGDMRLGGFLNGNNNVKIISPAGKKGAVKYGDDVSLMGANGKYFLVRYSGKVTAHASVIARDTKFKVVGGSGGVHIADRVSFKSEFGYMHAAEDGSTSVEGLTAAEKYLIGLPGQETGLKQANGLHYGEVVTFQNTDSQFMQTDHNGWCSIRAKPTGNFDHFTVLSATHADGIISYGSKIVLRAHNGRMVSVRLDNNALEAVSLSITDRSEFTILGSAGTASGVVHDRDMVALRTFQGYVNAAAGEARLFMGQSGHYSSHGPDASEFLIHKIWDSTL